jgi:hypothetical protein
MWLHSRPVDSDRLQVSRKPDFADGIQNCLHYERIFRSYRYHAGFRLGLRRGFPHTAEERRTHSNQGATKEMPVQWKGLFIKAAGGLLFVFAAISALIFLPSWTLNYWQAWTFLALFMISLSAIFIYLAKNDPNLLARRIQTTEKEKSQKMIRFLVNLAFAVVIVMSALDHRFTWSTISVQAVFVGDALALHFLRVQREHLYGPDR